MTLFAAVALILVVTCLLAGVWLTVEERRFKARLRRQHRREEQMRTGGPCHFRVLTNRPKVS